MKNKQLVSHILQSAKKLNELKDRIDATFKTKDKNPQAWKEATELFQSSYDKLAFPGGLTQGLERLKQYDPSTIAVAIEYLQADPYYHRSGYIKQKILRILKNAPLTEQQIKQLEAI